MIKKPLFVAVAVLAISACAAMDTLAGMGVVKQDTASFDNSTVISVSPNSLYAPGRALGTPLMLGARWTSAVPNSVALVMSYNSNVSGYGSAYLNLSGLSINIDGQISSYSAGQPTHLSSSAYNTVSHTIYTSSTNAIIVPYSVLQSMVAAKDCKLRIHTGEGYVDIDFSTAHIPGGKPTAITSIQKFMAKVAAVRH